VEPNAYERGWFGNNGQVGKRTREKQDNLLKQEFSQYEVDIRERGSTWRGQEQDADPRERRKKHVKKKLRGEDP